ncbi:MAG: hypothetical protein QXO75_11175 [Nitrososphaerota archaeon]
MKLLDVKMSEEIGEEEKERLRERIFRNIEESDFSIVDGRKLVIPENKDFIRKVHSNAAKFIRDGNREFIEKFEDEILRKLII